MKGQLVDITDSVTVAIRYLSWAIVALCGLNVVGICYLHKILKRLKSGR